MSVKCAICGGRFDGVGPSYDYGHDATMCALHTTKKLRVRIEELETALRKAIDGWEAAAAYKYRDADGITKARAVLQKSDAN